MATIEFDVDLDDLDLDIAEVAAYFLDMLKEASPKTLETIPKSDRLEISKIIVGKSKDGIAPFDTLEQQMKMEILLRAFNSFSLNEIETRFKE